MKIKFRQKNGEGVEGRGETVLSLAQIQWTGPPRWPPQVQGRVIARHNSLPGAALIHEFCCYSGVLLVLGSTLAGLSNSILERLSFRWYLFWAGPAPKNCEGGKFGLGHSSSLSFPSKPPVSLHFPSAVSDTQLSLFLQPELTLQARKLQPFLWFRLCLLM